MSSSTTTAGRRSSTSLLGSFRHCAAIDSIVRSRSSARLLRDAAQRAFYFYYLKVVRAVARRDDKLARNFLADSCLATTLSFRVN